MFRFSSSSVPIDAPVLFHLCSSSVTVLFMFCSNNGYDANSTFENKILFMIFIHIIYLWAKWFSSNEEVLRNVSVKLSKIFIAFFILSFLIFYFFLSFYLNIIDLLNIYIFNYFIIKFNKVRNSFIIKFFINLLLHQW